MSKFIKLTWSLGDSDVFVREALISGIFRSDEDCSVIYTPDREIFVKETPEQIMKLIEGDE
jgi:hypothetical protein